MSEDLEDLERLLQLRLESAQNLNKELTGKRYSSIQGIGKLRNRIVSEIKFLQGIESGKTALEKKYIETSNVTHFENIVAGITRYSDVTAVFFTFSILDPNTETVLKHTVDLVAKKGEQWVKVISRSAKGICMDWVAGSSRNVFEQAETYLEMADVFQRSFTAPEVIFEFIAGVPDKMAQKLQSMGVTVLGEQIPLGNVANIPEDYLEMLETSDTEEDNEDGERASTCDLPAINLDVSAVFVLISNLTHEGGTNHKFDSALLSQQLEMEVSRPARKELLDQIEGRDWIICRTAYDSVMSILKTVAGEREIERMDALMKRIRIVDDVLSERAHLLKLSDRITDRSQKIFGSGDFYRAVTATANKHFVSSAYHQGVSFDVILHESRALSEQKERQVD